MGIEERTYFMRGLRTTSEASREEDEGGGKEEDNRARNRETAPQIRGRTASPAVKQPA